MMDEKWLETLSADVEIPREVRAHAARAYETIMQEEPQYEAAAPKSRRVITFARSGRRRVLGVAAAVLAVIVISGVAGAFTLGGATNEAAISLSNEKGAYVESEYENSADVALEASDGAADVVEEAASESAGASDAMTPEDRTIVPGSGFDAGANSQKLVYTASVSIETIAYDDARTKLDELIKQTKSIIASENESLPGNNDYYEDYHRAYIDVRVPADNYEKFMEGLEDVGSIVSRQSDATNITRTYSDVQAEISSLETQARRLEELMAKAETVKDMLEIEDRLQEVNSELTAQKNWLAEMDTDVAYSTVSITLTDVTELGGIGAEPSIGQRIVNAFGSGWLGFTDLVSVIVLGIIVLWPLWVVAAIVVIIIVAVRRRKHARR